MTITIGIALKSYGPGYCFRISTNSYVCSIESIQNAVKSYDPQEMVLAGCIVTIDHGGDLQIGRAYVKPEDHAALDRLRQGDANTDGQGPTAASSHRRGVRRRLLRRLGGGTDRHPHGGDEG
ncbi:hypothetical protein HFN63_08485 [Rhizobium leguminosarum]|nr:hypothetical protein [Rhizobium leguminosarum]TBZ95948.1 hypothetical protein E0H57_33145 [Rhizobium leguminosarum bv. viciae]